MMPPLLFVPPPNAAGVGHGKRSSATAWTGEKRRKTVGLGQGSSFSDDADATETTMMDAQNQVQEEELVFSAESVVNFDELCRLYPVLRSREHHIHPSISPRLDKDGVRKVAERFYQFRYRDFKLKEGTGINLDDTTDTVPLMEYPVEVLEWDSPYEPGRGMFGWTFDPKTFDLADLDDYQRMIPKRASLDEYHQWEKYCLAFSNYETDEEYVKYWDELFKKIKWIEDYIHLMHGNEFAMYRSLGASQAMQIAERFCHLPASLVTLGYNEFIDALHDNFDLLRKDYGHVYLGLWKRVTKQGMSIQDALQDILALDNKLPLSCLHRIKSAIMGYDELLENFLICKKHIGKHIVDYDDDDTVLKHITDALRTKVERRKWYVDYAKTKLEIARRICMLPGGCQSQGIRAWDIYELRVFRSETLHRINLLNRSSAPLSRSLILHSNACNCSSSHTNFPFWNVLEITDRLGISNCFDKRRDVNSSSETFLNCLCAFLVSWMYALT